jgi:tetratricopeptide (TPR) repeat protein
MHPVSANKWNRRLLFAVPFIISFAVYLSTVCRTLFTGDSGELSATASTLSIAHPPGYPLLTLLGKVFLFFSWGNPAFTLNMLSALLASATAGITAIMIHSLLYSIEARDDIAATIISTAGGLLFGLSGALWAAAVGFEVYSLGILLVSLALLYLLRFEKSSQFGYILMAVYVFGLSLANHLSAVSLAPALVFLIVKSKPDFKRILILGIFFLAALTLYLYIPIRSAQNPLFDWNHPASPGAFLDHITARRYQTYITGFGFENWFQNIRRSLGIIMGQYPLYLLPLGFIGLIFSKKIKGNLRFVLLSIPVLNLVLSALYDIPDIDLYYLPSILVLTTGLILLFDYILSLVNIKVKNLVMMIAVIALAIGAFLQNYGTNDQRDNNLARLYGDNILKSTPEGSFLISVGDNSNSSLYYLRYVEGVRPDLEILDPVISIERLKRRMADLNLRSDLAGPNLCVLLSRVYPEKTFIVKEHMLARGNPFNYDKLNVYPHGMVYGFAELEDDLSLWERLTIPIYSDLSRKLDFKGMTMLVNLHLCYGEDLYHARKRREAVEQYREARKIAESTREASVHNSLGIFFRREGWATLARREYESALKAEHLTANEKSNIYVNLGNLEKDTRKMGKAIEFYQEALKTNDDNKDAEYNLYITRATLDLNREDYKSAVGNYEKALALPESDPGISFNLGVIYDQNLNDTSRAIYFYKRYIELSPASDRTRAADNRIEELKGYSTPGE